MDSFVHGKLSNMTASELLENALCLAPGERLKLAAELLASVAPGADVAGAEWERAWHVEVQQREALEPDDALGDEHELSAVRERLLHLFR
jgi:hypothetical protein